MWWPGDRLAYLTSGYTLLLILLLTDTFRPLSEYKDAWGAEAQLNLWADRRLVMRMIESVPSSSKSNSSLRCPKQRPDLQRHIPQQLFLVLNGHLLDEVYDNIRHNLHRPIPPQIEIIRVKWKAGLERLTYNITMTSLNQTVLFNPLLNVASYGQVPAMESDVQITLACTGKMSGNASFWLHVDIRREFETLRKIRPITFEAQKYCLTHKEFKRFQIRCDCRTYCQKYYPQYGKNRLRKLCNRNCRQYLRNQARNPRINRSRRVLYPSDKSYSGLRANKSPNSSNPNAFA